MKLRKTIGRRRRRNQGLHTYVDTAARRKARGGADPVCWHCYDDETRCDCAIPLERDTCGEHEHGDTCGMCGYGIVDPLYADLYAGTETCEHGVYLSDGGCHECAMESAYLRGNGTDYDDTL